MSVIKGFTSLIHNIKKDSAGLAVELSQLYQTLRRLGHQKAGIMTAPQWLAIQSSGNTLDASGSTEFVLSITGHSLSVGQVLRMTSGSFQSEEVQVEKVIDANTVQLNSPLSSVPAGSETFSVLVPMSPTLDSTGQISVVEGITSVVDFLDVGTYIPSSSGDGIIPRSSNNAVQVVASLAANVTKIQSVSDVGEFINLYTDAAKTNLLCHMVLTPDEIVDIDIPVGTSLYMGAAKDQDIDDNSSVIQLNFIG
jgi:hypothetical protein